ncbi:Phosphatidylcholine synthase [compost metagenome]
MLLSSAYGFNRTDAKTTDHYFTGFPSYWNIVVFYLLLLRFPSAVNGAILLALAASVFVPIRYIYPSRTPVLAWPTNVLGVIWAGLMLVLLWEYPAVSPPLLMASLVFPIYYVGLSLALHVRGRRKSAA